MSTTSLILMICAGSIPMAAWAANNGAVAGPVTGFIFNAQAGRIRPMLGMPGSAYLGATVVSDVNSASVSPDGSAAFAIQAGKLLLYTGLASGTPTAVGLRGAITADRFAWAPGATAAAIYSSKSAQAQIVSNLPETPSAGTPIDLRPKEFDLLLALFRQHDRVVSRADLLRDVWGYDASTVSRTVDTHMAGLRLKLEVDPLHPRHLLTVRTAGYLLRQEPDEA